VGWEVGGVGVGKSVGGDDGGDRKSNHNNSSNNNNNSNINISNIDSIKTSTDAIANTNTNITDDATQSAFHSMMRKLGKLPLTSPVPPKKLDIENHNLPVKSEGSPSLLPPALGSLPLTGQQQWRADSMIRIHSTLPDVFK
jgi:hypothetical protein